MCNTELLGALTRAGLAARDNPASLGPGGMGMEAGAGGAGMPQGFYGTGPNGFGLLPPMMPAGALPVGEAALPPGMARPQMPGLPQPVPQGSVPTGRPAVRPQPQPQPAMGPFQGMDVPERRGDFAPDPMGSGMVAPGSVGAAMPAFGEPSSPMRPPGFRDGLAAQIWGRTGLTNSPVGSTITMPSFSVPPMPPEMQAALAAGIANPPMPGGPDPLAGRMVGGAAAGAFNPGLPAPGDPNGLPWWNWSARAQARYPRQQ